MISSAASLTIPEETTWKVSEVLNLADFSYDDQEIGARIASGSFSTNGMLIVPCSMKTLSAVANSYCSNLIARAADVCLKEGRPLVLAVRETPLHRGHLRLMDLAAQAGAVIFPPVPSFYGKPQRLQDLVDASVGRMLARLGIENTIYPHWLGLSADKD